MFEATEAFNHARHPKTGRRNNWNDFQGWCIPAQNNPFIDEVKAALVYQQTSKDWLIKYCHSLMPNVAPTYKDVPTHPELQEHPFYKSKPRTVDTYFRTSLAHSSQHGQRAAAGRQPAGRHRARPLGPGADGAEGGDRQHEAAGCGQVGRQGAERHPARKHAPARLSRDDRAADRCRPCLSHRELRCALATHCPTAPVGLLFIAPFVAAALFFMVYPVVEAIRMAFYSYNPLRPDLSAFVGLDNFAFIFADPLFWDSFRQATVWTLAVDRVPDRVRRRASRCCCTRRCRASPCSAACCCSPTSCRRWSSRSSGAGSSIPRSAW